MDEKNKTFGTDVLDKHYRLRSQLKIICSIRATVRIIQSDEDLNGPVTKPREVTVIDGHRNHIHTKEKRTNTNLKIF